MMEPARRKQLRLDPAVLAALEALARDKGLTLDQLTDEAFRSLLKRNNRPVSLGEGLRASIRAEPANDRDPKRRQARS
jgi:hypothetical protein